MTDTPDTNTDFRPEARAPRGFADKRARELFAVQSDMLAKSIERLHANRGYVVYRIAPAPPPAPPESPP